MPKEKIAANGDYNLSGERYREQVVKTNVFPLAKISDVCTVNPSKSKIAELDKTTRVSFVPMADVNEHKISFRPSEEKLLSEVSASYTYFEDNDVLIAKVTPCFENGKAGIARGLLNGIGFGSSEFYVLRCSPQVLPEWIYFCVMHPLFRAPAISQMTGTGGLQRVPRDYVENFQIPLPPLEVQREIVAEIEGYQKVIDGARAVVDHYQPHIPIHPDWPLVEIGSISTIVRGSSPRPQGDPNFFGGLVPRLMVADVTRDGMYVTPQIDSLTEEGAKRSRPMSKGDVIITVSGNPGLPTILAIDACIHDGFVGLRELNTDVLPEYLYFALLALHARHGSQSVGAVFKNLTTDQIRNFKIALPPLGTQRAIAAEIEVERNLVAANRELVSRFEKKIETTIARIWGENTQQ